MGEKALRQVTFDFTSNKPYECGAAFLTLLAYPEPKAAEETLGRVHQSLCHLHLREKSKTDEKWSNAPQLLKPCYAFVEAGQIQKDLRQFDRRLRDRMIAAKMANLFLREAVNDKVPALPRGIERLSLNEVSKVVSSDVPGFDQPNIESRIWRPSLPVIHMAVALDLTLRGRDGEDPNLLHPYHLIGQGEVVQQILRDAQFCATLFYKSSRLKIPANTLIELQMIS